MRSALRMNQWWSGKIPPALAAAYLAACVNAGPLDVTAMARNLALFLVSSLGIGGIGYLLTDAFDVEEDRRIGKQNGWSALSPLARLVVSTCLLAAAALPWRWLPNARLGASLVVLEMLLFLLYAVPPIRLKERGVAGIVTDAVYAHVLPVAVAWTVFAGPPDTRGDEVLIALFLLWMLAMGMRHLARHQHDDLDRDRMAGIRTFAAGRGRDGTMRWIVRRLLPVEMVAALSALAWALPVAPLLLAGFVVHAFWELYVVRERWIAPLPPWRVMSDTERHDLLAQRVLSGFVERWLAPLALLSLVVHDARALWLVPLHLLVAGAPLRTWWHDVQSLPRFTKNPA
ncbi:MAG: UbiA family prenyltransferase [Gemmatimonadetes bacterium]|nr:UbiA family prenyltransferase [Gemmatimonadota bacterium]